MTDALNAIKTLMEILNAGAFNAHVMYPAAFALRFNFVQGANDELPCATVSQSIK